MEVLHRQDAEKWLGMLREGVTNYDECVRYLYASLAQAGITLSDLGSSPEEIESLSAKSARVLAETCLTALRAGFMRHYADTLITQMLRSCEAAHIPCTTLGVREDELGAYRTH